MMMAADRPRLRDIRLFSAVAEASSMRRAAEALGSRQSVVSQHIRELEDTLGVSLFERSRLGVRLTQAGRVFLNHVRPILRDLDNAIIEAGEAGAGKDGCIRIGMIASLSLGPLRTLVETYARSHPSVSLVFSESARGDLVSLLRERRLDVVYAAGDHLDHDLDSLVLTHERIFAALGERHRLSAREKVTWTELKNEPFIIRAYEPGPEIHDFLVKRLAELGSSPNITHHRVERETLMNLVGLGFGISIVAEHWCGVAYPGVVFRPTGDQIPFSLAWVPSNDNPAFRRFVSLARAQSKMNGVLSQTRGRSP